MPGEPTDGLKDIIMREILQELQISTTKAYYLSADTVA
jgi:hypothetical protein